MLRILVCALLLSVSFALTQGPASRAQEAKPSPTPSDNAQSKSEANSRIQRSVEDLLHGDQVLSSADIETTVDDYSITLTGHVDSYAQHQRVLALLEQYARYRKIVDKLQMK